MIVFFDIDDTLIDHSHAMRAAVRKIHQEFGLGNDLFTFETAWFDAHRRHNPRYLSGMITYEELRRVRVRETVVVQLDNQLADTFFAAYLKVYRSNWTLFDDVDYCLRALAGTQMGIISNGPSDEQRDQLQAMKIESHFQQILISTECRFAKPSPEIFWLACQMANVEPKNAVYVGDQPEIDAIASQKAGLRAIWLNRLDQSIGS